MFRTLHIEYGRRFCHLEANGSHRHAGARQFPDDEIEEALIANLLAGKIDGEETFLFFQVRAKVSQHLQGVRDDPAIDGWHQSAALGMRHEFIGRQWVTLVADTAQQNLEMRGFRSRGQWFDQLAIQ